MRCCVRIGQDTRPSDAGRIIVRFWHVDGRGSLGHDAGMVGEPARVVHLESERLPRRVENVPHSVTAEQALLGAIMVNNRCYDELQGSLAADHFYVPMHGAVFAAIEDIVNGRGGEANPITIRERLKGTHFDADKALFPHLTSMFENAALSGDMRSLADVIVTAYRQRQLMGLAESIHGQARAAARPEDVEAVLESAGSELFRLADVGSGGITMMGMRRGLVEVIRTAEAAKKSGTGVTGIASGFTDLDSLMGGFQPSDFIVLGARPSMGKTSLLLNIAQHVAQNCQRGLPNSAPVGVFSLEMSETQLIQRIVSNAAGISTQQMTSGRLSDGDMQRLVTAGNALEALPLYIDGTPALTIAALRSRARQMKRQYGIGLIVVDYLQQMSSPLRGDHNRVQEITQITQGLKHVARELNVPLIAASQLSRQLESRDDKRPQLSDLRESGSIEQDADAVLMLYREEYYISRALGVANDNERGSEAAQKKMWEAKERLEQVRGITELLVSKNRRGPTDAIKLMFDGATTTFRNYSAR